MAGDVGRIAEVLAEHALWGEILVCECGRWHWDAEVDNDPYSGHAAHQAEQLTAAGMGHVPTALHQAADELEDSTIADINNAIGRPEPEYHTATLVKAVMWLRNRADAVTEAKP